MKRYLWIAAVLFLVWICYVNLVYSKMQADPGSFNQFMAGVPMPAISTSPPIFFSRAAASIATDAPSL